jgi:hypothetical protein
VLLAAIATERRTEPGAAAGGLEAIPTATGADRHSRNCHGRLARGGWLAMSRSGLERQTKHVRWP